MTLVNSGYLSICNITEDKVALKAPNYGVKKALEKFKKEAD